MRPRRGEKLCFRLIAVLPSRAPTFCVSLRTPRFSVKLVRTEEGREVGLDDVALEDLVLNETEAAGADVRDDRLITGAGNGCARTVEVVLLTVQTVRRVGRPVRTENA